MSAKPYEWDDSGRLTDQRRQRRSEPPAGLCRSCWPQRRDVPGFQVDVYPKVGDGLRVLCPVCAGRMQAVGFKILLKPFPEAPDADALLKAVASPQAAIAERDALTLRRREEA